MIMRCETVCVEELPETFVLFVIEKFNPYIGNKGSQQTPRF